MKVFMAILSVLCVGGMLSEKDTHNKLMWSACFIVTIIGSMIMTSMQVM